MERLDAAAGVPLMTAPPIPLIVMRRIYYEAFCDGTKTVEYRRHLRPFKQTTYYPGRIVRLTYRYNKHTPSRLGRITRVNVQPANAFGEEIFAALCQHYPDLTGDAEIIAMSIALLP